MLYSISITCSRKMQEKIESVPKVGGDQIALVPTFCKVGGTHPTCQVILSVRLSFPSLHFFPPCPFCLPPVSFISSPSLPSAFLVSNTAPIVSMNPTQTPSCHVDRLSRLKCQKCVLHALQYFQNLFRKKQEEKNSQSQKLERPNSFGIHVL